MLKQFLITMLVVVCSIHLESSEPTMVESPPEYLYKIVSPSAWEESKRHHEVILSTMDTDFIHLAKEDQIDQIAQKFWHNMDYVVLKLATKKLKGNLIYETNPGGTNRYYHLYQGNIPLDAVVEVTFVSASQRMD